VFAYACKTCGLPAHVLIFLNVYCGEKYSTLSSVDVEITVRRCRRVSSDTNDKGEYLIGCYVMYIQLSQLELFC